MAEVGRIGAIDASRLQKGRNWKRTLTSLFRILQQSLRALLLLRATPPTIQSRSTLFHQLLPLLPFHPFPFITFSLRLPHLFALTRLA
jgi:hypothetical protein